MRDIMEIQLFSPDCDSDFLMLPTSRYEIQDELDRHHIPDNFKIRIENCEYAPELAGRIFDGSELDKLQILAQRIIDFQQDYFYNKFAYRALVQDLPKDASLDVLIQHTFNLEGVPVYPCRNDEEYGEIVLENEMLEELEDISDTLELDATAVNLTITKKKITVTGAKATDRDYDGTTVVPVTGTFVGIIDIDGNGTDDDVTPSMTGTIANANVGTGKSVTVTATLSGADSGNYEIEAPTGLTVNINAKAITVTGITASDKAYDGTTDATLVYTGITPALPAGLTVTATGKFADATVGTGKTVNITNIKLGGTGVENYVLASEGNQTSTTADITAPTITPTAGALVVQLDVDETKTYTLDISTLLPTLTSPKSYGTLDYALSAQTVSAGTASLSGSVLSLEVPASTSTITGSITVGITSTNYTIGNATITVSGTNKPVLTITGVTAKSGTYNGSAQTGYEGTPTAEGYDGEFTVAYSGTDAAHKNAGDYTVTFTPNDSDYAGSLTLNFTIAKKEVTITAKDVTVAKGSNSGTLPSFDCTVSGLVEGDVLTTAVAYDCTASDTNTAGTFAITPKNAAAGANYTIKFVSGTLTISTQYTVTFDANGGSAVAPQKVNANGKATKPADPTKTGFTFGGWYTDSACTTAYNFSSTVSEDITLYAKWTTASTNNNNNNSNNSSGGGYGGSGGGGSSGGGPVNTEPTLSNGKSGWSSISSDVKKAKDGDTLTVELNGATTVPTSVLTAAKGKDVTLEFKVNATYTWEINGKDIKSDKDAINVTVGQANISKEALLVDGIKGSKLTKSFKLSNAPFGVNATLKASVGAGYKDNFVNLYKLDAATGKLVFVGVTKIDKNGSAIIPATENGTYVIVIDKETKMPGDLDNSMKLTPADALALLKEYVGKFKTKTGLYKSDMNGDGRENPKDALIILKKYINRV